MSVFSNNSFATLIVNGRIASFSHDSFEDFLEDLIGRELSDREFLQGRTYLMEAHSPQLNNLYSQHTFFKTDEEAASSEAMRPITA